MTPVEIVAGSDAIVRCAWGSTPAIYRDYHDNEWGRGVTSDSGLFEKISLEGFQSGLSWLTILLKRDAFRADFANFDPAIVAHYGEADVARLMADAGIVRHEGKIRSVINNAQRALELIDAYGSLARYFWGYSDLADPLPPTDAATTTTSTAMAKDLKRRGWSYLGPTTAYSFMQSMGLVNDHARGCDSREPAEVSRRAAAAQIKMPTNGKEQQQ